jgi:hypothetical protein
MALSFLYLLTRRLIGMLVGSLRGMPKTSRSRSFATSSKCCAASSTELSSALPIERCSRC